MPYIVNQRFRLFAKTIITKKENDKLFVYFLIEVI